MMVDAHDREVVLRFKRLMQERGVQVLRTTLFGSRARGTAEAGSDYDVLVVVERLDRQVRSLISDCAWEAGFDEGLLIVPVVVSRHEAEETPLRSSLLMQAVREEGVTL